MLQPGELAHVADSDRGIVVVKRLGERLARVMTDRYRNFSPDPDETNTVELDPEDAEMLRALGYLE